MRDKTLFILFILISGLVFKACEKDPGQGGSSSIKGRVIVRQYNTNFTALLEQYPATDEDVFIVYGNDDFYGDKITTNFDGTFKFEYLRKGEYTIFSYSEDSANYPTQREIPVMQTVRITDNKQNIVLPDIIILK